MGLYPAHWNHNSFRPVAVVYAEENISRFIYRGNIGRRCCMWSVGLQSHEFFCRSPSKPTGWKRRQVVMSSHFWPKGKNKAQIWLQMHAKCAAKTLGHLLTRSANGINLRISLYYTGNFAQTLASISGTANALGALETCTWSILWTPYGCLT